MSSAAILSVYAVGYFNTSAADSVSPAANLDAILAAPTAQANTVVVPGNTATSPTPITGQGTTGSTTGPATSTSPAPTATPRVVPTPTVTASGLRDGSYTAVGTSRHGNIGVTVVVSGGKIVSADIVSCQTRYPCSRVSALPGEVLAKQSANINHVSGATDSSNAYKSAVAQAIAQAKA
ncbi:MAG: FMN-binding protein [Dehalococcoidia bacterium]